MEIIIIATTALMDKNSSNLFIKVQNIIKEKYKND
jgi:hypothetical protein